MNVCIQIFLTYTLYVYVYIYVYAICNTMRDGNAFYRASSICNFASFQFFRHSLIHALKLAAKSFKIFPMVKLIWLYVCIKLLYDELLISSMSDIQIDRQSFNLDKSWFNCLICLDLSCSVNCLISNLLRFIVGVDVL
ncbi:EC1118_1D0_7327p [Saccharomyces cerevisiae EC1118]|uniref:EC1118_1D0_7327p n=1 Tax=Saccharomyces cerevisiae (strain Lalvin EC1118 / Prise de mousse) TaxID=643680 RepID=C8Z5Y7_YEAS8|nr:EC1118_1D0_7327p [Saccharomyces cerevisiae EC1118]